MSNYQWLFLKFILEKTNIRELDITILRYLLLVKFSEEGSSMIAWGKAISRDMRENQENEMQ